MFIYVPKKSSILNHKYSMQRPARKSCRFICFMIVQNKITLRILLSHLLFFLSLFILIFCERRLSSKKKFTVPNLNERCLHTWVQFMIQNRKYCKLQQLNTKLKCCLWTENSLLYHELNLISKVTTSNIYIPDSVVPACSLQWRRSGPQRRWLRLHAVRMRSLACWTSMRAY